MMELTPDLSTTSVLLIGFVFGLQHAIEADHLAAVSTIVSEKKNLFTASLIGGMWGIGHTVSLFAVGVLAIFLKFRISGETEMRLEAIVGIMLVLLGANAFRKLLTAETVHVHAHEHGERAHLHLHTHRAGEDASVHHRFGVRSVLVGMIHGLAGSAALMLLVLPAIPSRALAVVYILVFGIGSVGGMMLMSFLIGLPFHFTASNFRFLNKGIRALAGVFSFAVGVYIIYGKLIAA